MSRRWAIGEKEQEQVPPLRVNKEDRQREILEAALSVFSKKGFHDAAVQEIANEAGIAKGTIYEYFKSKDDLFLSLLDYVFAEFFEEFAYPKEIDDPIKLLEEVFLEGLKVYQNQEQLLKFFIFYWGKSLGSTKDHIIQIKLRRSFRLNRAFIERAYLKGVEQKKFKDLNPTHVSATLMAIAEFLPMQWVLDKKVFSLREAGKTAFDIWLAGLLQDKNKRPA